MSASPAGPPSGPPSTTPNGGANLLQRKKKKNNAMVVKKPVRKAATRPPGQQLPARPANGPAPGPVAPKPAPAPAAAPVDAPDADDDPSLYTDYPLVTTKKALLEGLRYHVMRFTSDKPVNPYDPAEGQFQRPVRLQRRFPHDTPKEPPPAAGEGGVDDKERQKALIDKSEKQALREANQAQIAPTDKTAAAKKRQPFKKKTEDVYFPTDTPEAQKRAKLRYEEGRPWHLEDYTGTNSWVGTYEEPLSETTAMFTLESNGNFRMVPLEKWYRFAPTGRYSTLNLDEAEMHMNKKVKVSRFMGDQQKAEEKKRAEYERKQRLEKGRVGERGEQRRIKGEDDDERREDVANDADEIDFDLGEDFQDDDEDRLFLGDEEDTKEAERKIKEEQHSANVFAGVKDEKDWDAEEEREKRDAAEERKKAKKLRKNLIKREKKFEYESESDHPYSESSDSEDSDEERAREEEERKKQQEEEAKVNDEKLASGASSRGTNTPSGRPEKHDSLHNKSSIANLKRPGSPNLSEASGSESNHKRIKKENGQHSRAMSPAGSLSPNAPRRNAGSGSDTEGSGNERRPRPKHAASASAAGRSAPGSPANAGTPIGSRSGTPSVVAQLPTADEVRAAVPAEGITITALLAMFKPQISKVPGGNEAFVPIVRSVVRLIPGTKLVTVRGREG